MGTHQIPLTAGVLYKLLDGVHVGSVFGHFNGYKLETEIFGDAEVTVISGGGTEEFDFALLAPGRVAEAVGIALGNAVEHDV